VKSHEILVLLLRLRQVCCHCGLIAAMLDDREDVDEDPAGRDLLAELDKLSLEDKRDRRKVCCYLFHHHHQQPIHIPTAGAQAFLMDYMRRTGHNPQRGRIRVGGC
jgi:hypothetical protein